MVGREDVEGERGGKGGGRRGGGRGGEGGVRLLGIDEGIKGLEWGIAVWQPVAGAKKALSTLGDNDGRPWGPARELGLLQEMGMAPLQDARSPGF